MSEIIKESRCKKHGLLTIENSQIARSKGRPTRLRCRECKNTSAMVFRANGNTKVCKKHGELKSEDILSRGRCGICLREYGLNRDKVARNGYERKLYIKYLEENRVRGVTKNKNITIEQYYEMLKIQNNKCAICNKAETRKIKGSNEIARLCIDHCHETGIVRSLLCSDCNTGIGKLEDSPDLLRKAAEYIEHHKERSNAESKCSNPGESFKDRWRKCLRPLQQDLGRENLEHDYHNSGRRKIPR